MEEYVVQDFLIVVPVLYVLGLALKGTPRVQDWLIPWVLTLLGIAIGFGIGGFNTASALQGILCAAVSVYGNQLFKQVSSGIKNFKEEK